jgi:hypothetical protein
LVAACSLALAACSSGSSGSGTGGSSGTGTGGSPSGTGGSSSTGGTTGTGGSSSSGGTGGSATGTGGQVTGTGGSSTGGSGGSSTGTGGSSAGGHAGSSAGGHAGSTSTGTGGAGGDSTTGGGGSGACPSNATFCSGFEEASGPPANSTVGTATLEVYNGMFTDVMKLDTSVVHAGKQSLKVLSGAGSAYRMLSVPIPGPTFWVRMYMQSDKTFGDMTAVHNAWFQAMTSPDPNSAGQIQVAEQYCQVLLNVSDKLFPDGLSTCSTNGPTISANTWHCVEGYFDGTTGTVQVYSDGTKLVDAQNWSNAKETYGAFEFGFHLYSGPDRNVWYDDVVVAPTRVGCN